MYYCENCQKYFEEANDKEIDLENYYGVGDEFGSHHYSYISVCPYCGNEEIVEVDESELADFLLELYNKGKIDIDLVEALNK